MIIHGYSFMFRHRARFDIPDRIISQYDGEKQKKSIIDLIEMGSGGERWKWRFVGLISMGRNSSG